MASIEEKVEDYSKKILDKLGIRYFSKTEKINEAITVALKSANSKSGNSGNNYPDIKLLLSDKYNRYIPAMIEVKGSKNKLEKLDKEGNIVGITTYTSDTKNHKKGDPNFNAIKDYAVNGALHYGKAILNQETYNEVIIIGVNGTTLDEDGNLKDFESKAYYVSTKNNCVPKHIKELDNDFALLKQNNIEKLFGVLDKLSLTEKEIEDLKRKAESTLEEKIKSIHQSLYEDERLKTSLTTNEKLYLFCGLIMAGLRTEGIAPLNLDDFKGNNNEQNNDGTIILTSINSFLSSKNCSDEKIKMILRLLNSVFNKRRCFK